MAANSSQQHYDIVIAGGGMIGSSLALALAPLGLRLAMVEPVTRSAVSQPSFDDRSTALSRSTQRMYQAMGLWDAIAAASTPVTSIHVSDKGRFGFSHIDAREQGVDALGYVVINRVLGDVLQRALADVEGLDVLCPRRITNARTGTKFAAATIRNDERDSQDLTCSLLVAADGAKSTVRDLLGIGCKQVQYGQCAVVGNLRPEKAPDNRAYERFTEQGPLALLPMGGHRAAFIWTVLESEVDHLLALGDAAFLQELQNAFGHRLGAFSRVGERTAYPLVLSKALRLAAPRSVLIGNAAHGLHPVAAQGFNLGMRDIAVLCDCIADTLGSADDVADIGAAALLERYSIWRRNDHSKLVGFTHGLVRLFGRTSTPVRALRNIGMLGFDMVPGVRSLFAKHAMGLAGHLPRLSRGVPLS